MTGIEEQEDVTLGSIRAIAKGTPKEAKQTYYPWSIYFNKFEFYNRDYFIIKKEGVKAPTSCNNNTIIMFEYLLFKGYSFKDNKGLDEFFHSVKQIEQAINVGRNVQVSINKLLEEKKLLSRSLGGVNGVNYYKINFKEVVKQAHLIWNTDEEELKRIKAFFRL